MNQTEELDARPVLGMAKGGSFMQQLLTGGLLGTDKALGLLKKHPIMGSIIGGAGLPQLARRLQADSAPAPASGSAPTLSQEQIESLMRQKAQQAQQTARRGSPSLQAAQQVRQPFKGGGGLRQMVKLPSNRVRFGKTAYQNATMSSPPTAYSYPAVTRMANEPIEFEEIDIEELSKQFLGSSPYGTRAQMMAQAGVSPEQMAQVGAAPATLAAAAAEVEGASELDAGIEEEPKAPKEKKTPAPDKKKKGEDLYRSPEEAAYASLIDSKAGQQAAKRYFAGENVGLANISEALKAYKGFKDTEMAQRQKINEANLKKAAAARATRSAILKDAEILSQIAMNRDAPAIERMKAATKGLEAVQDTLRDLGESGKQAFAYRPESPLGQEYAKALGQRDIFLQITQNYTGESAQSRALGQGATGQAIQGSSPLTQEMFADILEQYKKG